MARWKFAAIIALSVLCLGSGWYGIASYVHTTVQNAVHRDDTRLKQAQEAADQSKREVGERVRILACQLVLAEINTSDPTTQTGKDKRVNFLRIAHDPLLRCLP